MPQIDPNHVKLQGGFVVWDGITQPEQVTQGQQAGKMKYTLKAVFPPTCPDLALYDQLCQKALAESKWRGVLPAGGRMPINPVQPGKYDNQFNGWFEISFKSTLKMPEVYNDSAVNGPQLIDPMQLGSFLYTGQKVDVLAHCYEYDAAGNKGISGGLDAIDLIVSAQAPRLNIGGYDTSAAFGGGGQAAAPAQNAAAPYQPPQHAAAPGYGAPPATSAPAAYAAPGAPPAQAHNFLPGQAPAAPAPIEVKYRTPDGGIWTEAQLVAAKWPVEQIRALPQA